MKIMVNYNIKKWLSAALLILAMMMAASCSSVEEGESSKKIMRENSISEKSLQENILQQGNVPQNNKLPLEIPQNENMLDSASAKSIEYTPMERRIKKNVYLGEENVGNLAESEALLSIKNIAEKTDKEPLDAALDSNTWHIKPGQIGKKVNVEKTLKALLNAREGKKIKPIMENVKPTVTSKMLSKNIIVIGNYRTPLLNRSASRVNNIKIASNKIDGFILQPGQEFSFNQTVGSISKSKGYQKAPVIVKTKNGPKLEDAIGGGICQVSTTLYNAVEECGFKILERHLHSKDVYYVPKGEDATVHYGGVDFRFRNDSSYPVMIRVYLKKRSLTIEIVENRIS